MSKPSLIFTYADIYGIPRQEALDWVISYIKRPGDFPALIEAGLIEDTEEKRKASIQEYIEFQVERSITGKIRREIFEERAAIAEFDGGLAREEAEKQAAKEMAKL